MRRLLALCSIAEALTGLVLLAYPPIVVKLLFGAEVSGPGAAAARVAGIALIALALSCWPGRDGARVASAPASGMLAYNLMLAIYLVFVGARGESAGVLLWPVAALHAGLALLLIIAWRHARVQESGAEAKPP